MTDSRAHREKGKPTSRKEWKQTDRQTDRQSRAATSPWLPQEVSFTLAHCAVNGKMISPLQTPLTSSPRCEADGGLTSVQLYLSGANIAWHEEGAAAERCPRYRPKFSQWNIVFIMSCCVALYPPNMSRVRAKQGAVLHYAAHTLFLPP